MQGWIAENWFTVLSAIGIVGGLLFPAVSLRSETKTRRISNLLILTQNHRDLWTQLLHYPPLARVLDKVADIRKQPITTDEELFVNFVIQHLNSAHQAMA